MCHREHKIIPAELSNVAAFTDINFIRFKFMIMSLGSLDVLRNWHILSRANQVNYNHTQIIQRQTRKHPASRVISMRFEARLTLETSSITINCQQAAADMSRCR